MIYLELFLSFLQIGLFNIGGGYAAIPLIQSQIVQLHEWLSMSEFTDLITIAEMTPGPIAVNAATFVGIRIAGVPGAVIATIGCILPSLFIVSLLFFLYNRYRQMAMMQSILACLRPAVVALITSAGLSILIQVVFAGMGIAVENINWAIGILFVISIVLLRLKDWNPILIIALCGVANLGIGMLLGI